MALKRRPLLPLLAAVWLLLGQCALLVHATSHELEAKPSPCLSCAGVHAFAGPPAVSAPPQRLSLLAPVGIAATRRAAAAFRHARPWHTGPPLTNA
jgi:hypothetical protein